MFVCTGAKDTQDNYFLQAQDELDQTKKADYKEILMSEHCPVGVIASSWQGNSRSHSRGKIGCFLPALTTEDWFVRNQQGPHVSLL